METAHNVASTAASTAQNVASTVYTTASRLIYGEGKPKEGTELGSGEQDKAAAENATSATEAKDTTQSALVSDTPNIQTSGGITQHAQGAGEPLGEPAGAQNEGVEESKDDGDAILEMKDPNDHSGEPLKMHDENEKKATTAEAEGDGIAKESTGEGTGEQWVKSTGLAADGGNFDATKPGAGREADRLLAEKGIHKDAGSIGAAQELDGDDSTPGSSGKRSKISRIKEKLEKLHIGHSKS